MGAAPNALAPPCPFLPPSPLFLPSFPAGFNRVRRFVGPAAAEVRGTGCPKGRHFGAKKSQLGF